MKRPLRTALVAVVSAAALLGAGRFAGSNGGWAAAQEVDMNKVFRCTAKDDAGIKQCAEARDIIMDNCTSCHTFVPIVVQQFDRSGWETGISRHVIDGRVPYMTPAQVKEITEYLIANFNSSLPVPELPPALLETWTP